MTDQIAGQAGADDMVSLAGIKKRHHSAFLLSARALSASPPDQRQGWDLEELQGVFEDLMQCAGCCTYKDGALASLGAYGALLDFDALSRVCDLFSEAELSSLTESYRLQSYLSPSFALLASWIPLIASNMRSMRHANAVVCVAPDKEAGRKKARLG